MSPKKGFSLVELLVSITLLSMMIFIATFGYQQFSRYWDRDLGSYDFKFAQLKGLNILSRTLTDVKPYVVLDENGEPYFYFEGGVSVIRSVRANSVSNPNVPASFQIKVFEDENNEGKVGVTYSELPLNAENFKQPQTWEKYTYNITILSGLDDIAFSYLGWGHYDQLLESEENSSELAQQVFGNYSGEDTLIIPSKISSEVIIDGELFSFDTSLPFIREDLLDFYSTSVD